MGFRRKFATTESPELCPRVLQGRCPQQPTQQDRPSSARFRCSPISTLRILVFAVLGASSSAAIPDLLQDFGSFATSIADTVFGKPAGWVGGQMLNPASDHLSEQLKDVVTQFDTSLKDRIDQALVGWNKSLENAGEIASGVIDHSFSDLDIRLNDVSEEISRAKEEVDATRIDVNTTVISWIERHFSSTVFRLLQATVVAISLLIILSASVRAVGTDRSTLSLNIRRYGKRLAVIWAVGSIVSGGIAYALFLMDEMLRRSYSTTHICNARSYEAEGQYAKALGEWQLASQRAGNGTFEEARSEFLWLYLKKRPANPDVYLGLVDRLRNAGSSVPADLEGCKESGRLGAIDPKRFAQLAAISLYATHGAGHYANEHRTTFAADAEGAWKYSFNEACRTAESRQDVLLVDLATMATVSNVRGILDTATEPNIALIRAIGFLDLAVACLSESTALHRLRSQLIGQWQLLHRKQEDVEAWRDLQERAEISNRIVASRVSVLRAISGTMQSEQGVNLVKVASTVGKSEYGRELIQKRMEHLKLKQDDPQSQQWQAALDNMGTSYKDGTRALARSMREFAQGAEGNFKAVGMSSLSARIAAARLADRVASRGKIAGKLEEAEQSINVERMAAIPRLPENFLGRLPSFQIPSWWPEHLKPMCIAQSGKLFLLSWRLSGGEWGTQTTLCGEHIILDASVLSGGAFISVKWSER